MDEAKLLGRRVRELRCWRDLTLRVGRALVAGKKTRDKGVHVLLHAEQVAPHRIRTDPIVRETVAGLLRHARDAAGGRELRGLAWRMGIAPRG